MSTKRDEKKLSKRKHKRRHKETDEWLVSLSIAVEGLEEYVYQQRDTSVAIDFDADELYVLSQYCKNKNLTLLEVVEKSIQDLVSRLEKEQQE